MQPEIIKLKENILKLNQGLDEISGLLQLRVSLLQPHFEAEAGERTQKGNETNFDPVKEVKREYSP